MRFPSASALLLVAATVAVAASTGPARAATDDGTWPVASRALLSGYRPPAAPWAAGHRGIDLAAEVGEPVRAVLAGRIGFAGAVAGRPVVTLLLGDGRRLTYQPVTTTLLAGTAVAPGAVIGRLARDPGHCGAGTGCLHLGLIGPTGYADPLSLLGRRPAVLRPDRR